MKTQCQCYTAPLSVGNNTFLKYKVFTLVVLAAAVASVVLFFNLRSIDRVKEYSLWSTSSEKRVSLGHPVVGCATWTTQGKTSSTFSIRDPRARSHADGVAVLCNQLALSLCTLYLNDMLMLSNQDQK